MNGRDDTITFSPLDSRIGGQNRDNPTVGQYLTRDQTRFMYKKVETGKIVIHKHNTARDRAEETVR